MGINRDSFTLVVGMTLFDVDTKSIGILIRRLSTREFQDCYYDHYDDHFVIPYEYYYGPDDDIYVAWLWDSLWSKDGRVVYSEDGLKNLIIAGIIVILDDNKTLHHLSGSTYDG
jgi:hypothetical protein